MHGRKNTLSFMHLMTLKKKNVIKIAILMGDKRETFFSNDFLFK